MNAMRQAGKAARPRYAYVLHLRLLWPFLVLLALFVIFFEFIAQVGGSPEAVPLPPEHPSPTPTAERLPDTGLPTLHLVKVIERDPPAFRPRAYRVNGSGRVGPLAARSPCSPCFVLPPELALTSDSRSGPVTLWTLARTLGPHYRI